ncbi:MAG: hypothetical protein GWM98_29645, partial [Nitrospinaceae bacterium]|nr:DJ-1/PfpI family protein [Nitrospinaceae bacterium]NIR57862.1 DJ-1/PfpI family protein [Nitrospinaceae bacterium]NIS88321.1 DJ-1/PfpI family protein [Nitrospinaceae bacterium]NIT85199.1 DJ-1/PfpI family protein [Nitrospinaceae bacterium]NIU47349.1 DJ-1/PfpI family protein [Nitrospinaceae bacterium]
MPKNQFQEKELFGLHTVLGKAGARLITLSPSGQEALGRNKTRYTPDGMMVDWDKQPGIMEKYHAVLVVGGKGAPKSLWNDPILPQILTDHYRAERVVGAIGLGVGVLARAALLFGETAGPEDDRLGKELDAAGVDRLEEPVLAQGNIITG